ncbi:MAG: hypothetical protein N2383_11125 [Caldilineales bacterium]|nr:hypothetical protein [Caldilineales bacterium]
MSAFAVLVMVGFFLTPWVVVTPVEFLPDPIQHGLDAAEMLLRRLAPPPIPGLLELLETVTVLPPSKWFVSGFLNPWLGFVLVLPLLVAALVLVLNLGAWLLHSDILAHIAAWIAACGAGLAGILLIVSLPSLEYLGFGSLYLARLALALMGSHLAWGYWLSLSSVIGLAVTGGLYLLLDETRHSMAGKPPYRQSLYRR